MVREFEELSAKNKDVERILVCITAQSNSKRLISNGVEIADSVDGELHIIHIQRGDNIFNNKNTPKLLEDLFSYGSEVGGMVHFFCDEDVSECIGKFTKNSGITKVVFGEPPSEEKLSKGKILKRLEKVIKDIQSGVEIVIVPRDDSMENIVIVRK